VVRDEFVVKGDSRRRMLKVLNHCGRRQTCHLIGLQAEFRIIKVL
jgi:hypothetical protein